ncbi:DUF6503 family protein [Winogradskyella poriferorum]|uniref:DUF6503 family protein n=1 Tax=Winogradskyella poriferorum TaxID=307627 RepID=UPI003D65F607
MKFLLSVALFFITFFQYAQEISAKELIKKTIEYHDPSGNWNSFNSIFKVVMATPNASDRTSTISINLPAQYFSVEATRDSITTSYILDKNECTMYYNDNILDTAAAKEKNMSCDRANLYKNYYTYLYGLPMKLTDPGTNIDNEVLKRSFKGKDYLVVKVTYDKAVGNDIWYFYFNPENYAMEVYQFFKTDDSGKLIKDSGEYILLTEESTINGIKMPKVRAWYYNKDDKYLGTDTLYRN